MPEAPQEFSADRSIARAQAAATIETPDPEHSLHIAFLALRLFDQLQSPLQLPAEGRDLLAAAALWHDVGQRRNLGEHHRISFDLIMGRRLAGFTPDEQAQIANIARYHRRAHPSIEHPGYRNLPRRARPLVDAMAALLRIAEGLDAGHLQQVVDVECQPRERDILVRVIGMSYPMQETERASERAGLFRETFGRQIEFVAVVRGTERRADSKSTGMNGEE